jgi:hypothetical protein
MDRVVAYIDGFNLYFGLKAEHGRKYLWLDLQALVEGLLLPNQTLSEVQYFTAHVRGDPDGERRQGAYLDALASHCQKVRRIDGRFQEKTRIRHCSPHFGRYRPAASHRIGQALAAGEANIRSVSASPVLRTPRAVGRC